MMYCPLRSQNSRVYCMDENCMWWDKEKNCCLCASVMKSYIQQNDPNNLIFRGGKRDD